MGTCEPDFKAAKGHINPHERKHGLLNPEGPGRRDLPNLFVAMNGSANTEFFTARVSLKRGTAPLLNDNGYAFIIHANRDDHMSQPIGGAGGRITCGVIKEM
ncbi:MAG: superoxide dismutase family protein [Acidiferrobacterales bacterium]